MSKINKITINLTIEINTMDEFVYKKITNLLSDEKIDGKKFVEELSLNHRSIFCVSQRIDKGSQGDETEINLYA